MPRILAAAILFYLGASLAAAAPAWGVLSLVAILFAVALTIDEAMRRR